MLKIRVMPTLLYKNLTLVKGVAFDSWRRVGSAMQAIKVYNMREVDELVFLDIAATTEGRRPDFRLIDDLADECFMPLTVGGGVQDVDDVRELLMVGADKAVINSAVVQRPDVISEVASRFGSQCVVVSIDARRTALGGYEVFTHSGSRPTGKDPVDLARQVESLGAGEILLTSIDRDGTQKGYDVEMTRRVTAAVSIPVIASGGAGHAGHMIEVLEQGRVSAVAAASIFHFTEQTPSEIKWALHEHGFKIRL